MWHFDGIMKQSAFLYARKKDCKEQAQQWWCGKTYLEDPRHVGKIFSPLETSRKTTTELNLFAGA